MPLDSDIGNNCKFLKKEENCFFILKNDYNEFSRNFAVFSTYQNGRYQYLSFEKTKFDITNDITNDELNKLIKNFEDKNFKKEIYASLTRTARTKLPNIHIRFPMRGSGLPRSWAAWRATISA